MHGLTAAMAMSVAAMAVAAVPARASAGVILGLRAGVGFPSGRIEGTDRIGDVVGWTSPGQLEAGWRFGGRLRGRLALSAFWALGPGHLEGDYSTLCEAQWASCIIDLNRYGVQGQWSFKPAARLDPWVGLGLAREELRNEYTTSATSQITYHRGWAGELQAGADFWVSRRFSLSPFLAWSIGRYGEAKYAALPDAGWVTVSDARVHTVLTVGVRLGWEFGAAPRTGAPVAPPQAAGAPSSGT